MDEAIIRAWWSHRQGLDGRLANAAAATVLEETGWARSVGGAGPYLGLYARCGVGREAVDRAVASIEIHELPSARGCTYVLPNSAFALGLKQGQSAPEADMKVACKLGVTDTEIAKLCNAVVEALKDGPLDPDGLRESTGQASRSLGEEGKKKGLSTTLPLALGPAILDRGRLVGLWEYDPEIQSIAWVSFIGSNAELETSVRRTEEFIRTDLGDARSFSLDSPNSRIPRIQALRRLGH